MAYAIRHRLRKRGELDPKSASPKQLVEQHPWHWDPEEENHNDDAHFIGNVDFDWAGLEDWAIDRANEVRVPQRWWWWDDENQQVMHSNDSVNHCPIYEQALEHVKFNNYNQHNSQYFKFANEELDDWEQPLRDMFPHLKHCGVSLFVQPPGQTIPSHCDTYSSYMRRVDEFPDYTKVERYIIFVNPWQWGHFLHWGNHQIHWKAGDLWNAKNGVYHGSGNCGIYPKVTIHWSGEVDQDLSWEDRWKHVKLK